MLRRFGLFLTLVSVVGLTVCGVASAATCSVNGGASFTKVPEVTVSFAAPGAAQYSISNSPIDGWSPWTDIGAANGVAWTLSRLPDPGRRQDRAHAVPHGTRRCFSGLLRGLDLPRHDAA